MNAFDYSTLDLFHERLCLDFTNTAGEHGDPNDNHLKSYADLVSWSQYEGVLNEDEARNLLVEAARHPAEAEAIFQQAFALREAMYRIFSAVAAGDQADAADLDIFNKGLSEALVHLRVVPETEGFAWGWAGSDNDLERMLWPVVWSASELMMSDDLKYVRECGGNDCDWLFLDTSRNHSRRWCSMETCGNRAKARRHYERTKIGE
jgi:predicted RNA-binding Zn ribbon-like protein